MSWPRYPGPIRCVNRPSATAMSPNWRDALEEYATVLQHTLLPPMLPPIPALAVAAHDHPASASQVGGDFYEVFALGGRWAFFLRDVEGHGPAAAAVTSLAQQL